MYHGTQMITVPHTLSYLRCLKELKFNCSKQGPRALAFVWYANKKIISPFINELYSLKDIWQRSSLIDVPSILDDLTAVKC